MIEYVRVRDTATGHHITVSAALAERHKSRYVELKQDATDRDGRPLPPRHKIAGATRAERPVPDADAPAPVEATTATNITAKATEEAQK